MDRGVYRRRSFPGEPQPQTGPNPEQAESRRGAPHRPGNSARYDLRWERTPDSGWAVEPGETQVRDRTVSADFWDISGPFSGLGPRGCRRPDERIREDLGERLTYDPQVDAREIEIQVEHGAVTLSGRVKSRREKRRAEDLAEAASGVWEVYNRLRVESRPGREAPDGVVDPAQIRVGREVLDPEGRHVGRIKEVRPGAILVYRDGRPDLRVPHRAFTSASGSLRLNVRLDEMDSQGWSQ